VGSTRLDEFSRSKDRADAAVPEDSLVELSVEETVRILQGPKSEEHHNVAYTPAAGGSGREAA
jgi:ATP-dependent Clp protease ATP-binding subunit ClpA